MEYMIGGSMASVLHQFGAFEEKLEYGWCFFVFVCFLLLTPLAHIGALICKILQELYTELP